VHHLHERVASENTDFLRLEFPDPFEGIAKSGNPMNPSINPHDHHHPHHINFAKHQALELRCNGHPAMPAMGTLQCLPAMLCTISIDSTIKLVELMRGRGSRPPFCQHFSILHYVLVHWGRGRDLMRFNNINRAARSAFPAPTPK